MRVETFPTHDDLCRALADHVVSLVGDLGSARGRCVLGLPTGHTPLGLYRELVARYEAGLVDFARVFTFNLDEYYPMEPRHPQSYHRYMREVLVDHVNLPPEQVHIPDGTVPRKHVAAHCAAYEAAIDELGGIDLQILGLGRNGHIGFNEPGSNAASRTRLVELEAVTRQDAAPNFGSEVAVPREAITMGIATILEAAEVVLVANGSHKTATVWRMLEEEISPQLPATYLRQHQHLAVYVDEDAAGRIG